MQILIEKSVGKIFNGDSEECLNQVVIHKTLWQEVANCRSFNDLILFYTTSAGTKFNSFGVPLYLGIFSSKLKHENTPNLSLRVSYPFM
ncbi:hypothetical protein NC653_041055 [Populus alba x Populus x berolinensis]|uniref:Uncharacterized protein n=1 Tax=Populus alba x Populus x berolinensis TaxID=444605 RepID=A0AAD6L7N0_9ROSI|nr:hypothetical protein NC653_041055 [Populus alba x Populus x berolinensis]